MIPRSRFLAGILGVSTLTLTVATVFAYAATPTSPPSPPTVGPITPATVEAGTAIAQKEPRIPPERAEVPVLQVFSAQDGTHMHRAYLVRWNGQDVVVSDTLAATSYSVGDTVTILVMRHPHPRANAGHDLLSFAIVPPRRR